MPIAFTNYEQHYLLLQVIMPYFIVHVLFNFATMKRLLFYVTPFFNATTLVAQHIKKFYSDFALHNKN
jgi:hypothetical protein